MSIEILNHLVNENNMTAYKAMYVVEVGLRELIIQSLDEIDPLWWKHRLPGDLVIKVKEGRNIEKGIKWTELIPHHPLYYLDFPDLKKIIDQTDNWNDVFHRYFANKEVFDGALKSLEPIRNKIAHNRKITSHEVTFIMGQLQILMNCIGVEIFIGYANKPTIAKDLLGSLRELEILATINLKYVLKYVPINSLDLWFEIRKSWWFDSDYLDTNIEPIFQYFLLLSEYSALPRYRGAGHHIQKWVTDHNINELFRNADKVLWDLINSR
jgi:hypothetical protein